MDVDLDLDFSEVQALSGAGLWAELMWGACRALLTRSHCGLVGAGSSAPFSPSSLCGAHVCVRRGRERVLGREIEPVHGEALPWGIMAA